MDKDINNNIDIDEDEDENEDVEEIIEPNTYIGDNNEYMNEYDEEEKEYYSAQWFKKEYNTDGLYNNIVVKSKKKNKKKNKKVKKMLDLQPTYKYMFDSNLIPWKYRIKKTNTKNIFNSDEFPSL